MMEPTVRFCTSADGTSIAYATMGKGPPLVYPPSWAANLEAELEIPEGRARNERLAHDRLWVRFDRRGTGASRREIEDLSLQAHVADVSAVVDHLGLGRFDLLGVAESACVAVAYAAQCPERVSRLVLLQSYPHGEDVVSPEAAQSLADLMCNNWSLGRKALADVVLPKGPTEAQRWFTDSLRQSVSPEVAARYVRFHGSVDVRSFLPQVRAPTLVLHYRGDRNIPIDAGRAVAALIPDARLVTLEGRGDFPFGGSSDLETVVQFLDEGEEFMGARPSGGTGLVTILFTDMESSTALRRKQGDAKVQELVRAHNAIVRDALKTSGGSEIKHTGDGIMASFTTATSALQCAIAIQRGVAAHREEHPDMPLGVYIGLNAGEPIAEEQDLFGTSVDLARRICDPR